MRLPLFVLLPALAVALLGCAPPVDVTPTPEPVRSADPLVPPPAPPVVQGSGGCPDGSAFLDLPHSARSWVVQADVSACCAVGTSQAAAVSCVHDALDGVIATYCYPAGTTCCLDPDGWVARLDHGLSLATVTTPVAGTAKKLFEIQIHRRISDERRTVWIVVPRNGATDLATQRGIDLAAAAVPPDVADCYAADGGDDLCERSSVALANYFAARFGSWDLALYAYGDARRMGAW